MQKVYSIAPWGLHGVVVEVEANLSRHLPKTILVGLPDAAVQEARERVWAAIENSGLTYPRQKVVVNLAPAQIRKEGGAYDLAIAISILAASKQVILADLRQAFIGELSLKGEIKSVPGILVLVSALKDFGFQEVYVPQANARELEILSGIKIIPVKNLLDLIHHLSGRNLLPALETKKLEFQSASSDFDFAEVKGQSQAKRMLEIAAAGHHNVLLIGSPGAGKTMLAKAFLSILPEPDLDAVLTTSKIYSLAGLLSEDEPLINRRLMRAPHHSASVAAMVGGGSWPKPGEISLAHHNVLFLDEILEFPKTVLEALRQPLEDQVVTVSRAKASVNYPAKFILLATANPCPCGYLLDQDKKCKCSPLEIQRYQKRISGPLLDRIDLHLQVNKVKTEDLILRQSQPENSETIRQRVKKAQSKQQKRLGKSSLNGQMTSTEVKRLCPLDRDLQELLSAASERLQLSARAYFKVLKVARTIADLAGREQIVESDLLEALRYRARILS
ncbi:YifB family Mg chelatase-like AAA ATPase [Candidatus Nomurabacteria bacterium]|nr:YifB family Mg chelatase-like AAA ATPase [Candidatus Nomurabacteria bacterium]